MHEGNRRFLLISPVIIMKMLTIKNHLKGAHNEDIILFFSHSLVLHKMHAPQYLYEPLKYILKLNEIAHYKCQSVSS